MSLADASTFRHNFLAQSWRGRIGRSHGVDRRSPDTTQAGGRGAERGAGGDDVVDQQDRCVAEVERPGCDGWAGEALVGAAAGERRTLRPAERGHHGTTDAATDLAS